jgi:hypothetical protein
MRAKRCTRCKRLRHPGDYYTSTSGRGGLSSQCKECIIAVVRARREREPEKLAIYERARWEREERKAAVKASLAKARVRDPERFARYQREYQARFPERRKARMMVGNALKRGVLVRSRCEVCDAPFAQAHHDDYSKPLDVRWLCTTCHGLRHRKERKEIG